MIQTTLFSVSTPATITTLRQKAEAGKQRGMSLAADARAEPVAAGQVAFLAALLCSPDGTATVDDATDDLTITFSNGGKWRGSIPSGLARRGIVVRVGVVQSDRPSRHRGFVSRWLLKDRSKAQSELDRLTGWLSVFEQKNPLSAGTDAGNGIENLTTQTIKESSNETY